MTDHRDPGQRLLYDVWRFKEQRNAALDESARLVSELERLTQVADHYRMEHVRPRLCGLRREEYFHERIGLENVLDANGFVDDRELETRLTILHREYPEWFKTPEDDSGTT